MGDMDTKSAALVVCVTSSVIFFVSFICDWLVKAEGQPTISQLVWKEPLLGIPALFPVFVALVSLAVHFYYR